MATFPKIIKLFFIFIGLGIGMLAIEILYKDSWVSLHHRHLIDVKPQNRSFKSTEATVKKKLNFLKTPLNFNSSCWTNPCQDKMKKTIGKMVFVVKSAAKNAKAREILRRTWAKVSFSKGFQLSSVFVIGRTDQARQALIDEEYKRYGDILQLNISDGYRFIAQKTLGGMEWVSENFPDHVFYTSSDDDIMIDIPELIDVIQRYEMKVRSELWGDFPIICSYRTRLSDGPDRANDSKYYISIKTYKWRNYPDYCLGEAYTTSIGIVRQLWKASRGVEPLKMDDVWITGILREKIGMPRQYIRKLDKPAAHHYAEFANKGSELDRIRLINDKWKALQKKFENVTICDCFM